ncbi:MAG: hypothetical protein WBQ69_11935 [Gallionella sp.]
MNISDEYYWPLVAGYVRFLAVYVTHRLAANGTEQNFDAYDDLSESSLPK